MNRDHGRLPAEPSCIDAIQTAMGKPGSPLKALYTGTLAPSTGGWWHDLVAEGSGDGVYVQVLQGDPKRWDQWPEIRKTNPLTEHLR